MRGKKKRTIKVMGIGHLEIKQNIYFFKMGE